MCFAILVYFDFGYVCSSLNLAILGTKMVQKWDFLKNPANPHDEIFLEGLVSYCGHICA